MKKIGSRGFLICLDRDLKAVEAVKRRLDNIWKKMTGGRGRQNYLVSRENFKNMGQAAEAAGFKKVDGVVFDLGVSSPQIDGAERGFSFDQDGPLDMRMDQAQQNTAEHIINQTGSEDLARIIRDFGEERLAGPIARAIVNVRDSRPIKTTGKLVAVVRKVLLQKGLQLHNKTLARIFQALRIAVNEELDNLQAGLTAALRLLAPGGRLAVVSFHSLEDRIVKEYFKRESTICLCPPVVPVCVCGHTAVLKILTRKPIEASSRELKDNPRARSAKLRAAEKLDGGKMEQAVERDN